MRGGYFWMNRVLVVGSINLDIVVRAPRHPRPGETVLGTAREYLPGGKGANQAVAAARSDAETWLAGKVGHDFAADLLRGFLRTTQVHLELVQVAEAAPTGIAVIVVDDRGENSIVVIPGANADLAETNLHDVIVGPGDVLLGQREIPDDTLLAVFQRGRAQGATTVLNAAPAGGLPAPLARLADVIVINETELWTIIGGQHDGNESLDAIARDAAALQDRFASATMVVSLGARGILALAPGERIFIEGRKVEAVDTTGAGDCLVGSFCAQLALGYSLREALAYANVAASLSVQRQGAAPSMPYRHEVETYL
jgi:ribokinase